MSVPSAVIFDLGKVLLDFDYDRVVRRLAAQGTQDLPSLRRMLMESPLLPAYERGECTSEEFFDRVREATGFRGGFTDFETDFGDIFSEIPGMIRLQGELRARGVPTFLFSNTNDLAVRHIRRRYPFFAGFDGYVLSYEHGAMKPDAPIYEAVERLTGRTGDALLYFDDRPENIATGRNRGWQAHLHLDPETSRERVRAAGLLD